MKIVMFEKKTLISGKLFHVHEGHEFSQITTNRFITKKQLAPLYFFASIRPIREISV